MINASFLTTLIIQSSTSAADLITSMMILKAAHSITEPLLWPNDRAALLLFLEDHLDSLINHFDYVITGPPVALTELTYKEDWQELKLHYNQGGLRLTAKEFWLKLFTNPHYSARFPNLLLLIELCFVMPIQMACCERRNSCLNRIMTNFRTSLDVSTVGALMPISLNGSECEEYNAS